MEPMQVAEAFASACKRTKSLVRELAEARKDQAQLEGQMLTLIEDEKLPPSFRTAGGASIYTREEIWASPLDGDHGKLSSVLSSLGLTEFLPQTVNSQSISGYIREFKDEETGELVGVPPELEAALKITKKPRCIAAGLG